MLTIKRAGDKYLESARRLNSPRLLQNSGKLRLVYILSTILSMAVTGTGIAFAFSRIVTTIRDVTSHVNSKRWVILDPRFRISRNEDDSTTARIL